MSLAPVTADCRLCGARLGQSSEVRRQQIVARSHADNCELGFACLDWFFFFSSRRRHTRCLSDWSSDVCSSDLERDESTFNNVARALGHCGAKQEAVKKTLWKELTGAKSNLVFAGPAIGLAYFEKDRSEERRVGKESRYAGASEQCRETAATRET